MKVSTSLAENLIDEYLKENGSPNKDLNVKIKEKLYDDLKKEIVEREKQIIIKESEKAINEKEQKKKIIRLKFLIFESLFLGFLVGLLVNQITDLISYLKGNTGINPKITWYYSLTLLVVILIFVFFMYLSKLEEMFIRKKEK